MKKPVLPIFLLIMMIAGCANLSSKHQMNMFDQISRAFRSAIRWSDFETANNFIKDSQTESNTPDFRKLKNIKVTLYEVKQIIPVNGKSKVRQIVEINYFKLDEMIEKTLVYDQLWEYDAADKRWYLKGGLPDFK